MPLGNTHGNRAQEAGPRFVGYSGRRGAGADKKMKMKRKERISRSIIRTFGFFALFLAIMQLVPYGNRHTNPPVRSEPEWADPETRTLFPRACRNCHSNETRWPWYSRFAPVSWLIQHDVEEGRSEFNVSEWGREKNEGDEAADLVRKGEMPLWIYLIAHPEARLAPQEREKLVRGLIATFGEKTTHRDKRERGG